MKLLEQSLCMMSGISPETEIRLRKQGIVSCRQLVGEAERIMSKEHAERVRNSFAEWEIAQSSNLVDWAIGHLPVGHRVRVLSDNWQDAMFYDIETDGTTCGSCITCISTLRDGRLQTFLNGRNLECFLKEWAQAKILVSFNGKRFDTPMVCKTFHLTAPPAQIDLMDEAAKYGYRGGLKKIEKDIGFARKSKWCHGGLDAIRVWHNYQQSQSNKDLDDLVEYNQEDVLSLEFLARHLLRLSIENLQVHF